MLLITITHTQYIDVWFINALYYKDQWSWVNGNFVSYYFVFFAVPEF